MTRLLWVNQFAITPVDGGGTRHFDLARAITPLGWDVTVVASDFHLHHRHFTRRSDAGDRTPAEETIQGVAFRWLWSFPYAGNDWRRLVNWVSFGWEVLRRGAGPRPDVVIGSSPQLFAALGAWVLARRQGVPFVLEVRDLWPESLEAVSGRRGVSYHLLGVLAQFLYRRADRIIVLAQGSIPVIQAVGIPATRIRYIPNGFDPATFPVVDRPERPTLTAIYAGAHGPANGLDVVLAAADQLRSEAGVRILLVGDGPAKDALVAEAARRGLNNVKFRASVPKAQLAQLFSDADAGLMVLRDTPLFAWGVSPNKLFDYLAAELPVVCNVPGDVAAKLRAAGAGEQAADGSAEAFANALRRLAARSPAERRAMGRRGRAWVLTEHNRVLLAGRVDALLRELIPV